MTFCAGCAGVGVVGLVGGLTRSRVSSCPPYDHQRNGACSKSRQRLDVAGSFWLSRLATTRQTGIHDWTTARLCRNRPSRRGLGIVRGGPRELQRHAEPVGGFLALRGLDAFRHGTRPRYACSHGCTAARGSGIVGRGSSAKSLFRLSMSLMSMSLAAAVSSTMAFARAFECCTRLALSFRSTRTSRRSRPASPRSRRRSAPRRSSSSVPCRTPPGTRSAAA